MEAVTERQNQLLKSSDCYACGQQNAAGLRLNFRHTGPFTAEAHTTTRRDHQGWNGLQHGGVTFTMLDEALGWCLYFEGIHAMTARVETRFVRPLPVDTAVRIRAYVTTNRRRLIDVCADVVSAEDEDIVYAEASATMMKISPQREAA